MPHYMDDMEESDDFPAMAKRKMMRAMKAKKMQDDQSHEMEKETEVSLMKVEINIGSNAKGKK
jgi:hypothetical protein